MLDNFDDMAVALLRRYPRRRPPGSLDGSRLAVLGLQGHQGAPLCRPSNRVAPAQTQENGSIHSTVLYPFPTSAVFVFPKKIFIYLSGKLKLLLSHEHMEEASACNWGDKGESFSMRDGGAGYSNPKKQEEVSFSL